jgi:putative polyketide hydroxylase
MDPEYSPCARAICGQHLLEPILWRTARSFDAITFMTRASIVDVRTNENLVIARVQRHSAASDIVVRAPIMIAADGARSSVRTSLGIQMDGSDHFARSLSILFECDLSQAISDRLSLLYKISNPMVTGALLHSDQSNLWMLMSDRIAPGHTDEQAYYNGLVAGALGAGHPPFSIREIRHWRPAAQVARTFRLHNVFLAGDAAHVSLPISGMGLNCGLQDAYNLAWKVSAYLGHHAGPHILSSYEPERRRVALTTVAEAVRQTYRQRRADVPDIVSDYKYVSPVILGPSHFGGRAREPRPDFTGRRFPHIWLPSRAGVRSTLDVLPYDFSVVCWRRSTPTDRIASLLRERGVVTRNVELRRAFTNDPDGLRPLGLGESGFMVVRPDCHVAWHVPDVPETSLAREESAIDHILGRAR